MPSAPPSHTTVSHGLNAGIALALQADSSGDWKAVADWLALNPAHAVELAEFLAAQRGLQSAIAPLRPLSDRVGSRVGGYELGEMIGRGGMGDVYRAFDTALKRDVAVKLLRSGETFSAVELARFRYEAELVASLDHPNVVSVYDYGETDAGPYLVMKLMAGGSLADRLRKAGADRQLDPKEAAKIVRDVASGVHHAHQRGLIHRDLKPGNILLDDAGTPHVADFGLARRMDATVSIAAGIAGTVAYMAPEQARGVKQLTTAADVYALGVILFELLTGGVPYGGADIANILKRLTDETEPVPPVSQFRPDAPADLAAVCAKCLEKRPDDRYASAQELADDLDLFLDGRPPKARPPGFWDWLRQLARIRPADGYTNPLWPVTAWFGGQILLTNLSIYAMVLTDAPAVWLWVADTLGGLSMFVTLWWYMLRRFREVPVIDRHSLVIATGAIFLYFPLLAAYVPLSWTVPARECLGMFPTLASVGGLGLFTLGSTNWSRFFPLGIALMCLSPILTRWPEEAPLIYGGSLAATMWYWAYVAGRTSRREQSAGAAGKAEGTP